MDVSDRAAMRSARLDVGPARDHATLAFAGGRRPPRRHRRRVGARRGGRRAPQRHRVLALSAATAAPDALVFGTQVGAHSVDYSRVPRILPEVVDGGEFDLAGGRGDPIDGVGKIDPRRARRAPSDDTHLYRTLSRPLLRHGRLPDPP